MAEIRTEQHGDCVGQIHISDEVIGTIAGTAVLEVAGVAGMSGNIADIAEFLGMKNLSKGVKIVVDEEEKVTVDIGIYIKSGYKIQEVSEEIQNKVKNAIETMTGLDVLEININIDGLIMDKNQINKKEGKVVDYE